MTLLVKLLRRSGVVIARDDLARRPWTMVQLLMEVDHATGRKRLVVREGEAGHRTEPFMELFQVTLASMSVEQFVLRGIESVDSGGCSAAVVQELACKVMPELGGLGWMSPRAKEFSRDFRSLQV